MLIPFHTIEHVFAEIFRIQLFLLSTTTVIVVVIRRVAFVVDVLGRAGVDHLQILPMISGKFSER